MTAEERRQRVDGIFHLLKGALEHYRESYYPLMSTLVSIRDEVNAVLVRDRVVLDPKYHVENGEVVKTSNGAAIPIDEPLILFRGRDSLAVKALEAYHDACVADHCTPYQVDAIRKRIDVFKRFAEEHPDRMKQPGCTMGK